MTRIEKDVYYDSKLGVILAKSVGQSTIMMICCSSFGCFILSAVFSIWTNGYTNIPSLILIGLSVATLWITGQAYSSICNL